jgi:flagella basal body P-ring formation protein FlgA
MTLSRRALLTTAGAALAPTPAAAATLRPFGTLSGPTVAVSDLWDDAGAVGSVVLGPAPPPGERIVVEAPQLAAIARQFGVAWRPASAGERSILERPGVLLPRDAVEAALRAWFARAAPAGGDTSIELTGYTAPLVAPDAAAEVAVERCALEETGGHFDATLVVTGRAMPALRVVVSGEVIAVATALLATRRLPPGGLVAAGDVALGHVARDRLRGPVATRPAQAEGLLLRRGLAKDEPVLLADLLPPPVILKGARVLIDIDMAGVAVTATGEALEQGALGARIAVRNPGSRAVLLAEITAPGRVRVAPGSLPLRLAAEGGAP